jgi:hypothetical protein
MPRQRKYDSDADRQAAYRRRKRQAQAGNVTNKLWLKREGAEGYTVEQIKSKAENIDHNGDREARLIQQRAGGLGLEFRNLTTRDVEIIAAVLRTNARYTMHISPLDNGTAWRIVSALWRNTERS